MNIRNRYAIGLTALALLVALQGIAQELTERKPARILPASAANILLQESRDALERPEEIIDRMGLQNGDIVADIGCGPGYYSLRLARRVAPHGVVFAVDIQQGMLDQLDERMDEAGVQNIYPVLGTETDPRLPMGKVDWVLLVDAYHEFSQPELMLEAIRASLAPGGRVALLEYRAEETQNAEVMPDFIPRDHKMTVEEVMSEWAPAGFELVERLEFLPAQHYFIFKQAGDSTNRSWTDTCPIVSLEVEGVASPATFGNRVYFAGQPTAEYLDKLASSGVKTVINLRTEQEMAGLDFDEKAAVEAAGMEYVHVPMGREPLSNDAMNSIFDALDRSGESSTLLHCASSNRVGAVWALYRAKRHGLDEEAAVSEGKKAGMRSPQLETTARELIQNK